MKIFNSSKLLVFFLLPFCCPGNAFSQLYQWIWIKGDNTINQSGVYGNMGISSLNNKPGARGESASWKDNEGNFWLYGGIGYGAGINPGPMSDLWKYKAYVNEWTWVKGPQLPMANPVYGTKGIPSASNTPGARQMCATWTDQSGNLWLFGGSGSYFFNDLWKFNPVSNQWTWMSGDNTGNVRGVYGSQSVVSSANKPGARTNAVCWSDGLGNLWLFGGNGFGASGNGGRLGDLWKYNINSNQWTWMKGDSAIQSLSVYGSMGVLSSSNKPGARIGACGWKDDSNNLWLFGGIGYASAYGVLNDLWKYNISTNEWVWIHGDSTIAHPAVYNNISFAGTVTRPGALHNAVSWKDNSGNVWLFGGRGYTASAYGELNALWKYNIAGNQWSFIKGDAATYVPGEYGTMGLPAEINKPGSREKPLAWTDSLGNLWLFGGENYPLNTTATYYHNDLWKFSLAQLLPVKLLSFTGRQQEKDILLQWNVENEMNFDHFVIERSFNGADFEMIGKVTASNSSKYNYNDRDIHQGGVHFYRLKMVDTDGNFIYSNIISFNLNDHNNFVIYPNPATVSAQLKFDHAISGNVLVEIMDMNGRMLQKNFYQVTGDFVTIPTDKLENGVYVIIIKDGKKRCQKKMTVTK